MLNPHTRFFLPIICFILFSCDQNGSNEPGKGRAYFFNNNGNDANDGSKDSPWQTIDKINATSFQPGDTIFLASNQNFKGAIILDAGDAGKVGSNVVITSSGNTSAMIDGGTGSALTINNSKFITVSHLHLMGAGRKDGNTANGFAINLSDHISVDSVNIEGFQKSGLLIYSSHVVDVNKVYAHNNGAAGIYASGQSHKTDCSSIVIRNSKAENNPGDPTNLTNHSGNGILTGFCTNVLIDYCSATNNGWDMPRVGNGPVGIWAYESDSVTIQHCISYQNKTATGADDGGGYDFDGGVTNSTIQYCLSYGNQGSAFGIFQYNGASVWNNNVIRYNISENDGAVSAAHAAMYIWNSSTVTGDFQNCFVYNNVFYNDKAAAISYASTSDRKNFFFYNNILIGKDAILNGDRKSDVFLGNDWRNLNSGFSVDGVQDFNTWISQSGQEKYNGAIVGMNTDPHFTSPGVTLQTDPQQLESFFAYALPAGSPLRSGGLDLKAIFSINTGGLDFNGKTASSKGIGAVLN